MTSNATYLRGLLAERDQAIEELKSLLADSTRRCVDANARARRCGDDLREADAEVAQLLYGRYHPYGGV